jgi:hypothetical protein
MQTQDSNAGLSIETFDGAGKLIDGVSFPRNLGKLAHEAGTCTFECNYCYEEGMTMMGSDHGEDYVPPSTSRGTLPTPPMSDLPHQEVVLQAMCECGRHLVAVWGRSFLWDDGIKNFVDKSGYMVGCLKCDIEDNIETEEERLAAA